MTAVTVDRPTRFRGGWRLIARKEFADHVSSIRFVLLVVLIALAGLAAVHSASGPIRDAAESGSNTPSIFLYLLTLSPDRVPSFLEFIAILGPLLGIAFGFDAINAERSQGTLPRLVSQPIHRDEIINGKFVAGIAAIAVALVAVVTVVGGYGAFQLGIGPTWSDIARVIAYVVVALVYVSLWLGLSIWFSVLSNRAATAALAAIAIWLVLTLFGGMIAGLIADSAHPIDQEVAQTVVDNARLEQNIRRVSPDQLYRDATGVLLNPSRQSTGIIVEQPDAAALPSTLRLGDSLMLAWWQVVALSGATIALFTASYVTFLRQEVRA